MHTKETGRWTNLCACCEIVYCLCGTVCYNVISNDLRGPLYLDQTVDIASIICSSVFWFLFIQRRMTLIYHKIKKVNKIQMLESYYVVLCTRVVNKVLRNQSNHLKNWLHSGVLFKLHDGYFNICSNFRMMKIFCEKFSQRTYDFFQFSRLEWNTSATIQGNTWTYFLHIWIYFDDHNNVFYDTIQHVIQIVHIKSNVCPDLHTLSDRFVKLNIYFLLSRQKFTATFLQLTKITFLPGSQSEPMIKLNTGKCLSKSTLIFLSIGYCTLFAHFMKCITAKPNLVGYNYPWDIVPLFSVSTGILQWIICIGNIKRIVFLVIYLCW